MSFPTPKQIQDRMVTLCGQISGVVTSSDGWPENPTPFATDEIPAIVVEMIPLSGSTPISKGEFSLPLDFLLTVLTDRFPRDFKIRDRATWATLENYALLVPQYFQQHPRLEYNDGGLAFSIILPRVQAYGALPLDKALYPSIQFRMTVNTIQS